MAGMARESKINFNDDYKLNLYQGDTLDIDIKKI